MTRPRFAAALSEHPVASHAVGETAGEIMERFGGDDPDLVVCFASPHFVGAMEDLAFALGNLLEPGVMLGATAVAVVGGPREVEDGPALSVFAASLPDARLTPVALGVEQTADGAAITGWPDLYHIPSNLLLLADPFSFPVDGFLRRLNDDAVGARMDELIEAAAGRVGPLIVVSSEVGCGLIPANALARRFGDVLGDANQRLARAAAEVHVCWAGIPVRIK